MEQLAYHVAVREANWNPLAILATPIAGEA